MLFILLLWHYKYLSEYPYFPDGLGSTSTAYLYLSLLKYHSNRKLENEVIKPVLRAILSNFFSSILSLWFCHVQHGGHMLSVVFQFTNPYHYFGGSKLSCHGCATLFSSFNLVAESFLLHQGLPQQNLCHLRWPCPSLLSLEQ